MENIESSLRQFRRLVARGESDDDSCPEDEKFVEPKDEFTPKELYRPIDFVQKFVMSDEEEREPVFALHYLEARFGDHYRGNRQGACWRQKENGKYVTCTFEDIYNWMSSMQEQWERCLTDPRDYKDEKKDKDYFTRWRRAWMDDPLKLNRAFLKKFLHYKHKNLPSVRSK